MKVSCEIVAVEAGSISKAPSIATATARPSSLGPRSRHPSKTASARTAFASGWAGSLGATTARRRSSDRMSPIQTRANPSPKRR